MFDYLLVTSICPYLWIISAVFILIGETFLGIRAPYGRYNQTNRGISPRLAWFIQEAPCFFIPIYLLYQYWSFVNQTKFLAITFYLIHYFQRVFIYSLLIRNGKSSSLSIVLTAFLFCFLNTYIIIKDILVYETYSKYDYLSIHFILGSIIFFLGFLLNLQADSILRNLRKDKENDYKIPRGGLFEYVSGANFLAESIEWTGYAICTWTFPALAYSIFTWANIAFGRALHHHQFYLEKFKDEYPSNRKAVIPFLL